jgi:hypothetical protein
MSNAPSRFWMLYAEGQRSPTYKHLSQQSANEEAERLAAQLRCKVHVLQVVASVELKEPFVWNTEYQNYDDYNPFDDDDAAVGVVS